jgi:hypothetical protein
VRNQWIDGAHNRPGYTQSLLLDKEDKRWRLIVLEDAADLVAPDAGAGLARLLNLTDGFVGQGLKVLVLVTGDEPLDRLHPAIARPGRCASEVAFERFDAGAAAAWLAKHGTRTHVGAASLAASSRGAPRFRGSARSASSRRECQIPRCRPDCLVETRRP